MYNIDSFFTHIHSDACQPRGRQSSVLSDISPSHKNRTHPHRLPRHLVSDKPCVPIHSATVPSILSSVAFRGPSA
jgi:hypothetical protein